MVVEVEAAIAGARVLWIAQRGEDAAAAFSNHINLHVNDIARVVRSRSVERIVYKSGGEIRYLSARSKGGRGCTADALALTPADYANADLMATLLPCVTTSRNPRVIIRTS